MIHHHGERIRPRAHLIIATSRECDLHRVAADSNGVSLMPNSAGANGAAPWLESVHRASAAQAKSHRECKCVLFSSDDRTALGTTVQCVVLCGELLCLKQS